MTTAPQPALDVVLYPLPAPSAYIELGGPAAQGPKVTLDRPAVARLELGRVSA